MIGAGLRPLRPQRLLPHTSDTPSPIRRLCTGCLGRVHAVTRPSTSVTEWRVRRPEGRALVDRSRRKRTDPQCTTSPLRRYGSVGRPVGGGGTPVCLNPEGGQLSRRQMEVEREEEEEERGWRRGGGGEEERQGQRRWRWVGAEVDERQRWGREERRGRWRSRSACLSEP